MDEWLLTIRMHVLKEKKYPSRLLNNSFQIEDKNEAP